MMIDLKNLNGGKKLIGLVKNKSKLINQPSLRNKESNPVRKNVYTSTSKLKNTF